MAPVSKGRHGVTGIVAAQVQRCWKEPDAALYGKAGPVQAGGKIRGADPKSQSGSRRTRLGGRVSRMLKDSFLPRLLKKVQMRGGAPGTHPQDGCRREAYFVRTSQRRGSAATP